MAGRRNARSWGGPATGESELNGSREHNWLHPEMLKTLALPGSSGR